MHFDQYVDDRLGNYAPDSHAAYVMDGYQLLAKDGAKPVCFLGEPVGPPGIMGGNSNGPTHEASSMAG
jgi:hypothetical protein